MKATIVYISSDNRSGSTLVDQLLGSNPRITSVGEIVHLNAYALEDRSLYNPRHPLVCSCGQRLLECPFWTAVASVGGRPLHSYQIRRERNAFQGTAIRMKWRVYVLNMLKGPLVSFNRAELIRHYTGGASEAQESFALFDAIGQATSKPFIVDSSKDPYRFLNLYYEQPDRMRVILLARDYRGVVHSKMKRGMSLDKAIRGWSHVLQRMERTASLLPPEKVIRITYEDLCLNTEAVIRRLCAFIGVPFSADMLSRSSPTTHHIGGSPSKFDVSRGTVSIDQSHLNAFSADQLEYMNSIAGHDAKRWGYPGN